MRLAILDEYAGEWIHTADNEKDIEQFFADDETFETGFEFIIFDLDTLYGRKVRLKRGIAFVGVDE